MSSTIDRLNTSTLSWSPRQLARRVLLACLPKNRFVDRFPNTGAIYLTFDDGPHPEHTPELLGLLKKLCARATFFVIGRECDRYPDIVRRIVDEGHAIGNHTYSHLDARRVSKRQYIEDIDRANDAIERVVGFAPRLFRPPYGRLSIATTGALALSDCKVVLWSVDTRDYTATDSAELCGWMSKTQFNDGDVVLMHDSKPYAAGALENVVRDAVERELQLRPVSVHRCRQFDARQPG